jgi:hypothetical protein
MIVRSKGLRYTWFMVEDLGIIRIQGFRVSSSGFVGLIRAMSAGQCW